MKLLIVLVASVLVLVTGYETVDEKAMEFLLTRLQRGVGEAVDVERRQTDSDDSTCMCPSNDDRDVMVNLCTAQPTMMCDSKPDCYDWRDQYACPCVCPQFGSTDGRSTVDLCANPNFLCDGVQDCDDARDEVACSYKEFVAIYKAGRTEINSQRKHQGIGYDWKRLLAALQKK